MTNHFINKALLLYRLQAHNPRGFAAQQEPVKNNWFYGPTAPKNLLIMEWGILSKYCEKSAIGLKSSKTPNMKKTMHATALMVLLLFITTGIKAQVGIGVAFASWNATAQLKVTSINSGFLPPRNTFAQRISIASHTADVLGIDKCAGTIVYVNDPCD
jgi:hypothetical protein